MELQRTGQPGPICTVTSKGRWTSSVYHKGMGCRAVQCSVGVKAAANVEAASALDICTSQFWADAQHTRALDAVHIHLTLTFLSAPRIRQGHRHLVRYFKACASRLDMHGLQPPRPSPLISWCPTCKMQYQLPSIKRITVSAMFAPGSLQSANFLHSERLQKPGAPQPG